MAGDGRGAADPLQNSRAPWRIRLAQTAARFRADVLFAIVDAVIVLIAYTSALVLRFTDLAGVTSGWWHSFALALPVILAVHLGANLLFGAYGHVWEHASVEEAMRLVAATITSVLALLGLLALYRWAGNPFGLFSTLVLVAGGGLTLGAMGAVRFRSRLFSFRRHGDPSEPVPTLVVGTSRAAADLARRGGTRSRPIRVVGFAATDGNDTARRLAGLPVFGGVDELPEMVELLGIEEVVIAASVGEQTIRRVVDGCLRIDVGLRILPDGDGVAGGGSGLQDVRDLELADLLPRPVVTIDLRDVAALLEGKRVLVTGAGGSIGSEIVRQVLEFSPASVEALDNDESHLYEAMLGWSQAKVQPTGILCDIRDAPRLRRVMEECRPQVVFHAAAHKHVPILEECPDEAVKTNIVGTVNLLEASRAQEVERLVLISTDKAVEPSSVMGASKRVAEMLIQIAATGNGYVYSAVRFGNVLGSRGSVVPTFMYQIRHGGPVTVSDPDMTRYFMMLGEAVQLVLQAAAMAEGGEVYVLDMGEPVRIGDLAHRMIRLAGLVPGRDIEIRVTGARPGEKDHEVLSECPLQPSGHPRVSRAVTAAPAPVTLLESVERLAGMADTHDLPAIREALMSLAWQNWQTDGVVDLRDLSEQDVREAR